MHNNTGGSGAATDHSIVTMEDTRAKIILQAQYICHLEFFSVHCVVLSPLFTVLQINRKRNTCFPLHFSALPMQEIRLDGFKEWTSLFLRYRCCKNNCEARAWRNLKFWPHCDAVLPQSREELLFVDPMKHLFGHSLRRP